MARDHLHVEDSLLLEGAVARGEVPQNRTVRKVLAKQGRRKKGKIQGASSGETAYFYERAGYMLSNFSAHAIEFEVAGKIHVFMTAEHAYQASKFTDQAIINKIGRALSPKEAKAIAHEHQSSYRSDWTVPVKLDLMESIYRAKAQQHQEVREFLRKSGSCRLVENSSRDNFWGTGPDDNGRNHAGKLWMKIRQDYQ